MPRYAAFLRGVSPTNCRMPELAKALEGAGFDDVKTHLSSGNVTFTTRAVSMDALKEKAEKAMVQSMGRRFLTFVRPIETLRAMLEADPYREFDLAPEAKRIVTFLQKTPRNKLRLPIEQDGARILAITGTEVFSVYEPTPKGPVFMTLLDKTFGKDQTTRTWQTIERVAG
jgi:uncharacterized protein (DUF1697 family)